MGIDLVPFTDLLSEIVDNRGRTCPTSESGMALIATNCVSNEHLFPTYEKLRYVDEETYKTWFRGHPEPGDLLFVTKGTPGRVCMVPDPVDFCIAQDMVAVRADETDIYPRYLFALLRSPDIQREIELLHVGTLIPHFKKGDFDKLLLPVPDTDIQRYIGDLYYTYSVKIDLNRRMNKTLEAIAQAIFKSWLVDFDPVYAKLEGRDPDLPAHIADLFPDRLVDSELGEIPEGWEVGKVSDEFIVIMGQSPPGSTYNEDGNGMPFYQGRTDFGFRYPGLRVFCTEPKRIAKAGDTLVSVRAPVGDTNIAMEECCIGRGVAAVRHRDEALSYTYYSMRALKDEFDRFEAEGTVFGSIGKRDFNALSRLIPDNRIIQAFEKTVMVFDEKIKLNEIERQTLAALRDTLLPRLISGELRVEEPEVFLERVT